MGARSVNVARLVYLLICEGAGVLIALSTKTNQDFTISVAWGMFGGLCVASIFIFAESLMKGFSLRGFSTATFGILVGMLCAWLLTRVGIDDLIAKGFGFQEEKANAVQLIANVVIFGSLSFIGAALALRSSREDFAFIIPYVRFRSDSLVDRPVLLDTAAIVDGRVQSLLQSGFLPRNLVVPDFVLDEVRSKADDPDPHEKREGKKGLLCLAELKKLQNVDLRVHDTRTISPEGGEEPERVTKIAQVLGARILTVSSDLAQLARLQSVEVLHLPDLLDALRPKIAVGEKIRLPLVRAGKDDQAIGYLPDGTMIVTNHAIDRLGTTQNVTIISTLETSSGTMVFAELDKE